MLVVVGRWARAVFAARRTVCNDDWTLDNVSIQAGLGTQAGSRHELVDPLQHVFSLLNFVNWRVGVITSYK